MGTEKSSFPRVRKNLTTLLYYCKVSTLKLTWREAFDRLHHLELKMGLTPEVTVLTTGPTHRKISNNKKKSTCFQNLEKKEKSKKKDVEYIATSNLLLQCKLKLFIWIYELGHSNVSFSKPLLSTWLYSHINCTDTLLYNIKVPSHIQIMYKIYAQNQFSVLGHVFQLHYGVCA